MEMLVSTSVLAIFVSIAMSSIVSLSKSSTSLINYQDMNKQGRSMMEVFSRDLRAATNVYETTSTRISFDTVTSDGTSQKVTYEYFPNADILYRSINDGLREIALEDASSFNLSFYTLRGDPTTTALETKRVEVAATIERKLLSTKNTNYFVSAQFVLRNHRVSN